jgi:hypothetical protein
VPGCNYWVDTKSNPTRHLKIYTLQNDLLTRAKN